MSLNEEYGGIVVWTSPNKENRAWSNTRHEVILTKEGVKHYLQSKMIVPVIQIVNGKEVETTLTLYKPVNVFKWQEDMEALEEELSSNVS
jgi:hypothetical protein